MKLTIEEHEVHYSKMPEERIETDFYTIRNEGIRLVRHELADGSELVEWIASNVIKEINCDKLQSMDDVSSEHDELIAELIESKSA